MEKKIKILLVEDNPGDARLIKESLKEADTGRFELECADCLSTGLAHIDKADAVLLDLGLPDSEGLDTVRRVHEHASHVPIVVLTGLADETVGVKAVQEGAQDYLIKGQVSGSLLVRSIRYSIERKRNEEALKESEERYRSLVESTDDSIYLVDSNCRYRFMNTKHKSRLGISDNNYIGRPYSEIHSAAETKNFNEIVNSIFKTTGMPKQHE